MMYARADTVRDPILLSKRGKLTSFRLIILGFAGVILTGALLLALPAAARGEVPVSLSDALFTSVSAVCVTGLVVRDTAVCWSGFGQAVILALIQVGGLGIVTFAVAFFHLSGRSISLRQRTTMQEAVSAPQLAGIVPLTGMILKGTLLIEGLGAAVMAPVFVRQYGIRGLWMAVFHSVSAFCNAGFDIMGTPEAPFASLTAYAGHPVINFTVMLLIITGGIGFLTWEDLRINGLKLKRCHLQTKVILVSTLVLIFLPAIWFYIVDFRALPLHKGIAESLFQSVTARTAGFNTADLVQMQSGSRAILILLMLIGGAPGSTAGGVKTTTFVILAANIKAICTLREDAQLFGRRIDRDSVRKASAIMGMYAALFIAGAILISAAEQLPLDDCLFETASAIGTVGLSAGITPGLGILSRCILMLLMFFGRVGGLTLLYAAISPSGKKVSQLPKEQITIG